MPRFPFFSGPGSFSQKSTSHFIFVVAYVTVLINFHLMIINTEKCVLKIQKLIKHIIKNTKCTQRDICNKY